MSIHFRYSYWSEGVTDSVVFQTNFVGQAEPSNYSGGIKLVFLGAKAWDETFTSTPTALTTITNGTINAGASTGSVQARLWAIKGNTPAVTTANPSQWMTVTLGYNSNTEYYNVTYATASKADATSTSFNVTGNQNLNVTVGDVVVVYTYHNDDAGGNSSPVLNVPGCTLSTLTTRVAATTVSGGDGRQYAYEAKVVSGTSTGVPTFTATTTAGKSDGVAIFAGLSKNTDYTTNLVGTAPNLTLNGTFESGTTGWGVTGDGAITVDAQAAHSGSLGLVLTRFQQTYGEAALANAVSSTLSSAVNATGNVYDQWARYKVKFWAKRHTAGGGANWSPGSLLVGGSDVRDSATYVQLTDQWQEYTAYLTGNTLTFSANIRWNPSTDYTGSVFIDDIQIYRYPKVMYVTSNAVTGSDTVADPGYNSVGPATVRASGQSSNSPSGDLAAATLFIRNPSQTYYTDQHDIAGLTKAIEMMEDIWGNGAVDYHNALWWKDNYTGNSITATFTQPYQSAHLVMWSLPDPTGTYDGWSGAAIRYRNDLGSNGYLPYIPYQIRYAIGPDIDVRGGDILIIAWQMGYWFPTRENFPFIWFPSLNRSLDFQRVYSGGIADSIGHNTQYRVYIARVPDDIGLYSPLNTYLKLPVMLEESSTGGDSATATTLMRLRPLLPPQSSGLSTSSGSAAATLLTGYKFGQAPFNPSPAIVSTATVDHLATTDLNPSPVFEMVSVPTAYGNAPLLLQPAITGSSTVTGAVTYDATSTLASGTGSRSWTHTPAGTARGVIVYVVQGGAQPDQTDGVTYGGQALTLVGVFNDTTEAGSVSAWFLGSGLPSGAQSISVSRTSTATYIAAAFTVSAGQDTMVLDWDGNINASTSSMPISVDIPADSTAFVSGAVYSGENALSSVIDNASMTDATTVDFGNFVGVISRYNTIVAANQTFTGLGWTQSADDAAWIGVAIGVDKPTYHEGDGALTIPGLTLSGTLGPSTRNATAAPDFSPTFTAVGLREGAPILGTPLLELAPALEGQLGVLVKASAAAATLVEPTGTAVGALKRVGDEEIPAVTRSAGKPGTNPYLRQRQSPYR